MTFHSQYGLLFTKTLVGFGSYESIESISNQALQLSSFLIFLKSNSETIMNYYVPLIDGVVSSASTEQFAYDDNLVIIDSQNTTISYNFNEEYTIILPTHDFKQIILEWYYFLKANEFNTHLNLNLSLTSQYLPNAPTSPPPHQHLH